jgi:hypothetical protein
MESAVLSKDVRDSQVTVEPEDAYEDLLWFPAEAPAGPFADERFIL